MAVDVAPELYERIQTRAKELHSTNPQLKDIAARLERGAVKLTDQHAYARAMGDDLSQALLGELRADALPDGRLYRNIAEKTVRPALMQQAEDVGEALTKLQEALDEKSGVKVRPVAAPVPEDRIDGLIAKASDPWQDLDEARKWLGEPIVNLSEHLADDFARENARTRSGAGLKAMVYRIQAPRCCAWCADAAGAGRYEYGDEPEDFWRRHEYCRCIVVHEYNGERTSAWTKQTWKASDSVLRERRETGKELTVLTPGEAAAEQARLLELAAELRRIMKESGISRERARDILARRKR